MFGSIYTGMSGLTAYSKGLDVISNNVANLNTPGYKGSDLVFQDLFYGYQLSGELNKNLADMQIGKGVATERTSIAFSQGELRETGRDTDASIDGQGFFILRSGDSSYYTRSGRFEFDDEGYLVASGVGYRLAAFDADGKLADISIKGLESSAPSPSTKVSFTNNLSTGSTKHELDVQVIDTAGNPHTLKVTLVNNNEVTPRSWIIEVQDKDGNTIGEPGEIRFQGNGSPEAEFNKYEFTYSPDESDPMDLVFEFGEPDSFTGVTSFSGGSQSNMAVREVDGAGQGGIVEMGFDRDGVFNIQYSNGEQYTGPTLAVAGFQNLQHLQQLGSGLFITNQTVEPLITAANQNGMGEIVGKSIELSNVELTQQFTDLIIVQRGYQASSQILTVANEMLQQLLQATGNGK